MIKIIKQGIVVAVFGVIIVGAVSVRGLFDSTRSKLVGTWNVSFEMTQSDLSNMGVTTNPIVQATASIVAKAIKGDMKVDFRKDSTMRMDLSSFGFSTGESGTWKVGNKSDGGVIVLTQLAGQSEEQEWKIKFLDDDSFEMTPPEGSRFPITQLVVFRRVTEVADAGVSGWK